MAGKSRPVVGLVWSQFAPYHLDRCEAAGACLRDQADVLAIEVATASRTYAWEPSGTLHQARKITLFPGMAYEDVHVWRRFRSLLSATRGCTTVFFGIGYNELHIVMLALILRLLGKRVIMMTDSKFDDQQRRMPLEMFKSFILNVFHGALVAGHRQERYMRFLGFRRRPVMLGYDCISVKRIRQQVGFPLPSPPAWGERPFLCVGRMVPKKNHAAMIDAYARYVRVQGAGARRLVLIGDGPLKAELLAQAARLGVADKVDMAGFLQAPDVAAAMARALALLLVSNEEQWGLVINEAVALDLPVIVSSQVGACDLLVENLVNGYIVSARDVDAIANAMVAMGRSEEAWRAMSQGAARLAQKGDAACFAQSVKMMTAT